MFKNRYLRLLLSLIFIATLLLSASCAPQATPAAEEPAAEEAAAEEVVAEEPAAEEAPAEEAAPEEPAAEEAPAEEAPPAEGQTLILATTTSTYDSGLLDAILPDFEEQTGVKVDVIAVGTGAALQMGEDGNADVLLVHARALEDAFMEANHGVRREDVMYNDFVVLGPPDDPAGIMGKNNAAKTFGMIAEAEAPFISRGDNSGTHTKELAIWAEAGIEPAGDWYISAGQGMGAVITMANEQLAYTLSDRATYLARTLEGIDLEIMVQGDSVLFNPYGVIAVNPDKGDHIQAELANQFIDWLIAVPTQELIAEFGIDKFGSPLFTPDSQPWRDNAPAEEAGEEAAAEEGDAEVALKITGNVAEEKSWSEDKIHAMDTLDVESTNSSGESEVYTGVLISALLEKAKPNDDASTLVLVADDGYTAEIVLADVMACENCILSFRTKGGFTSRMPDYPGSLQVKGVVELQVK